MFEAFWEDKTNFKLKVILKTLVGFLLLLLAFLLHSQYTTERSKNLELMAKQKAEQEWLEKFDYKGAVKAKNSLLKPAKQEDVHSIINRQIEIFKKHGIIVENVSTTEFKPLGKGKNKGELINDVKTTVNLKGNWREYKSAFNEFHGNKLVGIREFNMSLNKKSAKLDIPPDKNINVKLVFSTYYM